VPCLHRGQVVAASNSRAFIRQVLPNKVRIDGVLFGAKPHARCQLRSPRVVLRPAQERSFVVAITSIPIDATVRAGGVASTEAEWAGWATEAERAVCRLRRRRASSVQVEASLIRLQTTSVRRPSPRRSLGGGVIKIGLSGDARPSCFRVAHRRAADPR
jgi:hypothetical protein